MNNKSYVSVGDVSFTPEQVASIAVAVMLDKKALQPVVLDLRSLSAFTELFAIVSAANTRQVYAIAEAVRKFFKTNMGLTPISVDGLETCTWVLIDYGFLFIHIFQDTTRELYQLEQLWSKARIVPVEENDYKSLYNSVVELNKVNEELTEIESTSTSLN